MSFQQILLQLKRQLQLSLGFQMPLPPWCFKPKGWGLAACVITYDFMPVLTLCGACLEILNHFWIRDLAKDVSSPAVSSTSFPWSLHYSSGFFFSLAVCFNGKSLS
jgi:hypothetical protein